MRHLLAAFASLLVVPCALAQTAAPAPQIKPPEIGKIFAQTFSDHDVELLTNVLRDALQGRPVDKTRLQPLQQKMEGLAGVMAQEMLSQSLPLIDKMEADVKRELRRLREQREPAR
jgi:hypothetical protein